MELIAKKSVNKNTNHVTIQERFRGIARKGSKLTWSFVRFVIIFGICFVILQPLLTKFAVSLMSEADLYDATVQYVPREITFQNYIDAFVGMDYAATFGRTLALSLIASVLQLASCTIVGYGFARFKFPFKNTIFMLVILCLLVPPMTLMLPLFLHFRFFDIFGLFEMMSGKPGINLLDSLWPFVLTSIFAQGYKNGLYIFLLRQYFKGMPVELEEAAYIDGCSAFKTFYKVMLPSAVPILVTVFLFGFVWQWTDSFYSSLYLSDFKVMSGGLGSLAANIYSSELSFISPALTSMMNNTGTILVIFPLFVLYLFAQRYFVESIERSGIVG
ncbi:carbohydrate ABC transporter permease [Caldibacillus lycopersici]|uniref:Carbohydrate ABC transporter permease n=1 Tax=Perspicuibacillus lycopersici TaxID=1325689 RepID=A0AAE3IQB5_9BACI|nr:carbohydrate ABC transporter permease [Perspicuibacillus lycopersici]MCU9612635.1 carbohydrate ABC transporter permease [Perspicuibacillus lycopersici]